MTVNLNDDVQDFWQAELKAEIQAECVDKSLESNYMDKYIPLGQSIGMSKYRVESLIKRQLEMTGMDDLFDKPIESKSIIEQLISQKSHKKPIEKLYWNPITSLETNRIIDPLLHEYSPIDVLFKDKLICARASNLQLSKDSILYAMPLKYYQHPDGELYFKGLHKQRLRLSRNAGPIQTNEQCAYFSENPPEGVPLHNYIAVFGSFSSTNFSDLGKKDLSLIYALMENYNANGDLAKYPLSQCYVKELANESLIEKYAIDSLQYVDYEDIDPASFHNSVAEILPPGQYLQIQEKFELY